MVKVRETAIISGKELTDLVASRVMAKFGGRLTSFKLESSETIRVFFEVELGEDITKELCELKDKTAKTENGKKVKKEPKCKIDDAVVVYGITEHGRCECRRFGHAWRLKSASRERWFISPLLPKDAGKFFCGSEVKPKIYHAKLTLLTKDADSPNRDFAVILCIPFPEKFNSKKIQKVFEAKNVDIRKL